MINLKQSKKGCPDDDRCYFKYKIKSNDFWISENKLSDKLCNDIINLKVPLIDLEEIVWNYLNEANEKAGWRYQIDSIEKMQLHRYNSDNNYTWHRDGLGDHFGTWPNGKTRKLSMSILLNRDFKGGEFSFFATSRKYPKNVLDVKGQAMTFPSFLSHQVSDVTEGTRYTLVVFFLGDPFV